MSTDFAVKFDSKLKDSVALEYVFVTNPRIFSFSHRGIHSLRHPRLSFVQYQDEFGMNVGTAQQPTSRRGRRMSIEKPTKKHERIDLTSNANYKEEEEFVWLELGHVFDTVCFEKGSEIENRRDAVLTNWTVQRMLELWWAFFSNGSQYITKETYASLQRALTCHLLRESPLEFPSETLALMTECDWTVDVDPDVGGVTYSNFSISLLELADNWNSSLDPESYGRYLDQLLTNVKLWYEEPKKVEQKTQEEKAIEWQGITSSIVSLAESQLPPFPMIVVQETAMGPTYVVTEIDSMMMM
eukprot:PhF_6_TR19745/c0_g1_i1/m.28812